MENGMMPPTIWQYELLRLDVEGALTARVDLDDARKQLNRLGKDGWELVSAVAGSESGAILCLLKRPA